MSLFISSVFTYDEDAGNYIQAVETADAQALEPATRKAINNFVIGCKADGTWDAIKASCILAGARTLAGALVPLVGTAPTNVGGLFVSGDYTRKTGLIGNGSTKYLNSNRAGNTDPDTNSHISVYNTTTETGFYIGANGPVQANELQNGLVYFQNRSVTVPTGATGFYGAERTGSVLTGRAGNTNATSTVNLGLLTSPSSTYAIFARNISGVPAAYTNARLAFYSIGEALNLALLDGRVTDLINAFAVTIP